jgi:hypothetical protein
MPTNHEVIKWFNSPEDLLAFCGLSSTQKANMEGGPSTRYSDFSGMPYDRALTTLRDGDASRVVLAKDLFDKVVMSEAATIGRDILLPAIVGNVPLVPAVIAGIPDNMLARSRIEMESAFAPIRIFYDCGVSEGVNQKQILERGIICLAFTMVMNTIRPIELYTVATVTPSYNSRGAVSVVTKIDTKPLDLARAVWMLSDVAYLRRLMFCATMAAIRDEITDETNYGLCQHKKTDYQPMHIKWPWDIVPTANGYIERIKLHLQLEPQDIYIKGGFLLDKGWNDPLQWINDMVRRHTQKTEQLIDYE